MTQVETPSELTRSPRVIAASYPLTWLESKLESVRPHQASFAPEVQSLQLRAAARLLSEGAPHSRVEAWKYTSLRDFAGGAIKGSSDTEAQPDTALDALPQLTARVVFVDGVFDAKQSAIDDLPLGIAVSRLSSVLSDASHPSYSAVLEQLGKSGQLEHHDAFISNFGLALLQDGLVVSCDEGLCESPTIEIVWRSKGQHSETDIPAIATSRVFVFAATRIPCTILECFEGEGNYCTVANTTVVAGSSAKVTHARIQRQSGAAVHLSATHAWLGDESVVHTICINAGGELVRNEVYAEVNGRGANAFLSGVSVAGKNQLVDNYTVIDHALPGSQSIERYKGIYADKAKGIFNGTIIVRQDAQQTNAIQSNNSLLLSDDAASFSRPQLKIWADDVKCTHGATVGQMDEQALFYLRARGVPLEQAKVLLMHAFTSEAFENVEDRELKHYLEQQVFSQLDSVTRL